MGKLLRNHRRNTSPFDIIEKKDNMNRHKYIKGDIVRNRYTKKLSLVTEVFDASFVLADTIVPQFGYKAQVTISPIYEFVRHLSNYEFENLINRSI